jgi:two-component system OmpR family sensor kinase
LSSLRTRLVVALIGVLLAAGAIASFATYLSARAEVNDLLDEELRQVALSVREYALLDLGRMDARAVDPEHRVMVQVWEIAGGVIYLSNGTTPLPLAARPGYATFAHEGREWRTYTLFLGRRAIQTAQPTALRTTLAARAGLRILVPVLAVIPLLAALVWLIVGRALAPLSNIAATIAKRSPASLDPLPAAGLPDEVAPLVTGLNGLLERLAGAFGMQKRFAADAAHELRTPLTALGLQIQLLERAQDDAERAVAIERLKEGVKRATRLVQQLLVAARLEPDSAAQQFARVELDALARRAASDMAALAEAKPVGLTVEASEPIAVNGNEEGLRILASNLLDNAIRYTPAGGHVVVRARRDGTDAILEVADDGPGIPPEERERVFDRFYRGSGVEVPGSGLGLAIARQVADLHGGRMAIGAGLDGRGAAVRLQLPALTNV